MLLSDRVAIITGGARGIGKGIALKFAEEGCSTVIADVLAEEARETLKELAEKGREAIFVQCDVSDSSQVNGMVGQVISKFGKVDILVNNAGIGPEPKSIIDTPEEEWDRVLAINLKGVFLCCKAAAPHMKEKGYGKIINISSGAAITSLFPYAHYCASKAGVLGLTYDLAVQLGPFNICVNAILPFAILTDMIRTNLIPPGVSEEDWIEQRVKFHALPLQRYGTTEDLAGAALFLASELSGYVTGERLIVGGGWPHRAPQRI